MKTKDLLSQLSRLEHSLNDFSFEELGALEASQLKNSFNLFRDELEHRIFQPKTAKDLEENAQDARTKVDSKKDSQIDANLLVAQVSHEIRTPLNGIIGFVDLLKEDELTKLQLERVNAIQTASYSLLEIINELLEYSKLSAGLEKFESIDFQLSSLVNDVMYLCKTLLTNKNIVLDAHVDNEIPEVLLGDPSKLTQVLLNILGNAIKFVADGSIRLSIFLKKKKNDVYFIEFIIEDTGIGISEENLKHIFDSFKQAEDHTYAQYGGTGLGLNIVKQIVENLGGDISVSSKVGNGTTFRFLLPYTKGRVENLVKQSQQISEEKAKIAVQELRILVFEDNTLNQKLIEQRLKSWGCVVHVTDNAHYGLNILENHSIDLVLMDLKMPKMDGYEVTELIRRSKTKHVCEIPIIALTADFSMHDHEKCAQHKINDFILKPFATDELLNKLIQNTKHMKKNISQTSKLVDPVSEVFSDATKINLSIFLEQCLGKTDVLEELVMLYKQNVLEFMGVLSTNLPNGDMKLIGDAVHKIQSGLAMMQSESLHSIVMQIQSVLRADGDQKQLQFLFDSFVNEYPLVEEAIEEQITALKNC